MSAKRNILIAAVAVVGGYVAYRAVRSRFASSSIEQDYAPPVAPAYKPGAIRADQVVTVRSGTPITKKEKGMQYFPILSAKKVGLLTERSFRPTIDGFFTGRILTQSKREYAEVQPASSSLSGMGDISEDLITSLATITAQIDALAGTRPARGTRMALLRQKGAINRQMRSSKPVVLDEFGFAIQPQAGAAIDRWGGA